MRMGSHLPKNWKCGTGILSNVYVSCLETHARLEMRCGQQTGGGRYRPVDWNSISSTLSLTLVKELLPLGATVVPVIISSDKTHLSQF